MGLIAEYCEVARRYRAGTLCEPVPRPRRSAFDPVPDPVLATCFGKQPLSRIATEPAFSFGNLTREGNEKVFISKECSRSQPGDNSQGPKYMLKPTFGAGNVPAHTVESSARRAPNCVFGTDDRWSAQRREDIGRSLVRREAAPMPMPMRRHAVAAAWPSDGACGEPGMYRAFDVLNLGASLWNILQTRQVHEHEIEHDNDLHVRGLAASAEHHYQQLIAELLAAAKEADRDVWEQRNGQFNNLMLASILMFGVSMSAIIEGNFDMTESHICILLFSTFEALALSTLFLSLVCCLLVSRRMSVYMITRTGKLVERLSFIIKSADMLAADASGISSLPSPVIYKPRRHAGAGAHSHDSGTAREVAQERWKAVLQAISERRIPLHTSGFEVEPIHDGAGNTLTHSEVAARRLTSMRSAQVSLQRELIRALESTSAGQRAVAAGAGVRRQVEPPAGHVPLDSFSVDGEDSHPLLEHRRTINAACSSSSWSETAGHTDFRRQWSNGPSGAGARSPRISEPVSSLRSEQSRQAEAHPRTAGQGAGTRYYGAPRGTATSNAGAPAAASDASSHRGGSSYRGLAGARADRAEAAERAREEDSRAEHIAAVNAALKLSGRIQTFDEFWKRHCRWISNLAFSSFYIGSGCVWGAVIVFFWGMFDDVLAGAAGVFVGICGCALLGSLVLVVHTLREDVGVRIETRLGYTTDGTNTPEKGMAKL